jgi:putative redox protein
MRTVTVSWDSELSRFTALGTHHNQPIAINAPRPPGQHAAPTGFSATELLLASAGSCAAWDVVEIIRKRRQAIRDISVTVEGEQLPDPPWTYTGVTLHFRIACDGMRLPVMQRVVRLSCVRYCSVLTTIAGVARIAATVEVVTADGATSGRVPVDLTVVGAASAAVDEPALGVAEPLADEELA